MHCIIETIQFGALLLGLSVSYQYYDIYPAWDVSFSQEKDLVLYILAGIGFYLTSRIVLYILWFPFHKVHQAGYLLSTFAILFISVLGSIPYFLLYDRQMSQQWKAGLGALVGPKWTQILSTQLNPIRSELLLLARIFVLLGLLQLIFTPAVILCRQFYSRCNKSIKS